MNIEISTETDAVEKALERAERLHGTDTTAVRNNIRELHDNKADTEQSMQ